VNNLDLPAKREDRVCKENNSLSAIYVTEFSVLLYASADVVIAGHILIWARQSHKWLCYSSSKCKSRDQPGRVGQIVELGCD
jgi:hypothetical protein